MYALNYFIVTEKYNIILGYLMSTNYYWYEIYDRPPEYSDEMKILSRIGKSYFEKAAFQCFIYLWLSHIKQNSTHVYYFVQKNLFRVTKYILPGTVKTVSLILRHKVRIKTLEVFTNDTFHINISISGFSRSFSPGNYYISVYELDNSSSYHYISTTDLISPNWIDYRHRNIYSKNPNALLVFYSWIEYSELIVHFSLSVTTCKPVTINVCSLSIPCASSNNELCKEFLEETKDLSNVQSSLGISFKNLYKHRPSLKFYEIDLLFAIESRKCVVFQFIYDISKLVRPSHIESCSIGRFMHNIISAPGKQIIYNISAYIKGV